jgi:hypothetical protein
MINICFDFILFSEYIRVQLAYCLQQQDKNVEALTLYNDVLKSKYNLLYCLVKFAFI